jgi:anti-sigma factor RsiW
MKKTFTKNDLVAYAYGEATEAQIQATEAALSADPALITELIHLVEAQAALPRVKFSPRRRIVNAILRYARGEPAGPQLCY